MQTCPNCGQENPAGARFCNACGSPLAVEAPAQPEERKIVTILFVDLVGFTSRSERLDPEDVRAIQVPYFTRVRNTVESFGGTVEKYIGDAVMAVFGAPVAHGDDPERAVRAALAIAETADDLDLRIAVNTGEALVSLGSNAAQEGIVSGDVVNTASRLQAAAPVNGILVGEETYLATRGVIAYDEAEAVVAKGKQDPVAVWRPVGVRTDPGERPAGPVPMVGRATELEALRGIWARVTAERRPQLVTLFGPAGIGKSRLTAEFSELVAGEGARVIRGRSLPYGEMTPYGSFGAQVKQVAGMFDTDSIDAAREKLTRAMTGLIDGAGAEVSSHLAKLIGVSREEGGEDDRQTLFFAARRFIEALAEQQPTVLVFEDIHVAASSMLDLLEMLASRVRDVPLLLLTQARPELLSGRPAWGGGLPAYSALPLEPLRGDEARELARRLLDAAGGPVQSADDVVETAEGNPLFLEELASSVAEGRADPNELPTSIRSIVAARIDSLPPDEREALLDGAVFGKVFWSEALPSISPAALDALEARDLIRRDPVSRLGAGFPQYAFRHQLLREVAYATLPRARRRRLHQSIALFLEEAVGEIGDVTPALAHHWQEAGEPARAGRYYIEAGDHANRGWAKREAAAYYLSALSLVPEDELDVRRTLTKRIAVASAASVHAEDMLAGKGPERPAVADSS